MSSDLLGALTTEVGNLLSPLQRAVEVPGALDSLLTFLGAPPDNDDPSIGAAISAVVDAKKQIEALAANDSPSLDDIVNALQACRHAFDTLRKIDASDGPLAQAPGFSSDVVEWLVCSWLDARFPIVHEIAALLTVIELEVDQDFTDQETVGTQVVRNSFRIERLHLDRVAALLRDPLAVLRTAYQTPLLTGADADAMADRLFPKLVGLLRALGINCRYGVGEGDETLLGDSAPLMNHALIVYVSDPLKDLASEAGVVLSFSSADRGDLGLVISPFGTLSASRVVGPFLVDLGVTADIDVLAVGRHGLTLLADSSTEVSAHLSATLPKPTSGPAFVVGSRTGSRLEIGGARLAADTSLSTDKQRLALSADVLSSAIVIAGGDGDGFLAEILPKDGIRATLDLGIAWASDTGVTLRGSGGLDATLAANLAIGPITLSSIHVGLLAQADGSLIADISANVAAVIGPVHASVERVGLGATLSFPSGGGNLGVADLSFGFKSPTGIGLSIDAQGVLTGGGFVQFDPARGMYAGVLQLSFHDKITLTAYGIITTTMPDGSRGYSLLIFITADGFKPIPLGFGFMLQSIGGMVGVHRTFDENVLKAGLKTDSLSTLLFPRDPVGNAPALIQALASAFPASKGSYLIGLLARITWFTPTLVQFDLALILEFGARTRLLMLGRVAALLPSRDNDLIRINLDVMGVLDFDAGTLAADAVLVDSRLVHQFPITGSAALRARWSGDANFILAVGGFNPRFAVPAGFPTLERVTIALCSGSNPRLVCDSYFALTANTVQFGARASLYAEAVGFSITGDIGFDALVTLLPPHFLIDFHASMQLKRGSHNLFKLTIDGTLEGPLPLRIAAKAKFEILWFSFTVHFDFTLTAGDVAQAAIPAVSLITELTKALADPASWTTRLAAGVAHGVALRPLAATAGSGAVLDPLGQLVVQQQVVPLNTTRDITTFGGAPVTGDPRFHVTATLNGQAGTSVSGAFAPARYFTMSDDDKLVAPSFETMDAGLVVGDPTTSYDAAAIAPADLTYFPITLAPLPAPGAQTASLAPRALPPTTPPRYAMPLDALTHQRPTGAAARVPVRRVGRARFRTPVATPPAVVAPPQWRVVRVSDGLVAPLDPNVSTWSEYRDALATLNRGGATWQMVPAHEVLV